MFGARTLFRFRGIPIRVHWSLLVALPLLGLIFARNFADAALAAGIPPELLDNRVWLWGLLVAAGVFVSVLLHELAHSLYAQRTGGRVAEITLLIVGGVSRLSAPPKKNRDELITALVGPLLSLALGALLLGVHALGNSLDVGSFNLRFAFFALGSVNIGLGLFNLLPAFPMDGGRILRSALTPRMGVVRATRAAASVGKAFAVAFGVIGILTFSFTLVLIAFFVYVGAEAEGRSVVMKDLLGRVSVGDVMTPGGAPIDAEASLTECAARMRAERSTALPVLGAGRVAGVVTLQDIRRVQQHLRDEVTVGAIAHPVVPLAPGDNAMDSLARIEGTPSTIVPVVDGTGALVGTFSYADVERALALAALDTPARARTWWRERPV